MRSTLKPIHKVAMFITTRSDLIKSQSTVKLSRLLRILIKILQESMGLMVYLASHFLSKGADLHSVSSLRSHLGWTAG